MSSATSDEKLTLHYGHAHQVARAPIALNETPSTGHVDGIPRVPEPVALEFYPRLVSGRLAVAFDNNAMEAGVTVERADDRLVVRFSLVHYFGLENLISAPRWPTLWKLFVVKRQRATFKISGSHRGYLQRRVWHSLLSMSAEIPSNNSLTEIDSLVRLPARSLAIDW